MACKDELAVTNEKVEHRSKTIEAPLSIWRARAEKLLAAEGADPPPEPDWLLRVAESVLALLADEDLLAVLSPEERVKLLVHASSGGEWSAIIAAARDDLRNLIVDPKHKIFEPEPENEGIRAVTKEAAALRRRVIQITDGIRADRDLSFLLRSRIFGGRKITNTKPGWIHELASMLAAIRLLDDLLTDALEAMIPQIEAMLDKVTNAKAAPSHPPQQRWHWSDDVKLEQKTLHLALDALVSWVNAVAPALMSSVERRIQTSPGSSASAENLQNTGDQETDLPESNVDTGPVELGGETPETPESSEASETSEAPTTSETSAASESSDPSQVPATSAGTESQGDRKAENEKKTA